MELPEHLQELVERLGQAVIEALANDPECKNLTSEIQSEGMGDYEIALMVEITVGLHRKEEGKPTNSGEAPAPVPLWIERLAPGMPQAPEAEPQKGAWSDDDKDFLKTFRISLD